MRTRAHTHTLERDRVGKRSVYSSSCEVTNPIVGFHPHDLIQPHLPGSLNIITLVVRIPTCESVSAGQVLRVCHIPQVCLMIEMTETHSSKISVTELLEVS